MLRKITLATSLALLTQLALALPQGFVYLSKVDPTIQQDIRYAGYHNFIGRPINGYQTPQCILTKPAAQALKQVQTELLKQHLSLKVYDCYRPQKAVDDFYTWSKNPDDILMKKEFYPRVNKGKLFDLQYIAQYSSHSMGSTVDLTIVPVPTPKQANYIQGQKLASCYSSYGQRFKDNSIDMGTGFDCLDPSASIGATGISSTATANRNLLQKVMVEHGFEPYAREWWHFTYINQPYPNQFYNFDVT